MMFLVVELRSGYTNTPAKTLLDHPIHVLAQTQAEQMVT